MSSSNLPPHSSDLELGLAALKSKDYQQSIAILQPIAQSENPSKFKAQVGLVMAYERTGNTKSALTLCRNLTQCHQEKIQTWATDYLKKLLKRNPPKLNKVESIDIENSNPSDETLPSELPPIIETGFIPLNPNLQPTKAKSTLGKVPKPSSISPPQKSPSVPVPQAPSLNREKTKSTFQKPSSKIPPSTVNSEPEIIESSPAPAVQEWQLRQAGRATNWKQLKPLQSSPFKLEQLLMAVGLTWFIPIVLAFINNTLNQIWIWQPILNPWQQLSRQPWQIIFILLFLFIVGWIWQTSRFFAEFILTILSILWLTPHLLDKLLEITNQALTWLPLLQPIPLFYRDPTQGVYITLLILWVFSPWLWDGLLKLSYGLKPLPLTTLFNYSQETNKLLRNYCQKKKIKFPEVKLLPINDPIIFSYGSFRRFARIVVSQGLLDQLTEEELAAIFAREIASIGEWDFAVMSFATIISQIPYLIYWYLAEFSEKLPQLNLPFPTFIQKLIYEIVNAIATFICPLCYGLYKLLRFPSLYLSRRRVYYSDRIACNLTGNPNALTRGLLKITIKLSQTIQNKRKTDFILEAFDRLIPLSYQQALTWGSVTPYTSPDSLFQWDLTNSYTFWLTLNQSHPLIGERLKILSFYANYWKLEPEFDLSNFNPPKPQKFDLNNSPLLLQGAPFFGILAGMAIGGTLWLMGGLCSILGLWQLEWLWGDYWIMAGCIPIGCSLGIFIRTNPFFPEIKSSNLLNQPHLSDLVIKPNAIPLDSQPICLTGQLLGRTGLKNTFAQDLILQTSTGMVKLHYLPQWTPLSNFWPRIMQPQELITQTIKITGWWRRGATPWIDVDTLETSDHRTVLQGGHPLWSTILALGFTLWGAYLVSQGGW
ncbi:M48 family metalloprotease [Planktothrix mougeotii]|uniref:M48 family metalloprotease n=1 Tax=Planktothrix mougeotii LEGE 06226 TaxID=1828728 RepID=A0ABR9UJ69_9CYAN|nr:M48 family metalloprotease [Planktothrix mougeotii]MBE9146503.1 M48 family metalloprotease [Planktothrix mougeotii LEGE 06226]